MSILRLVKATEENLEDAYEIFYRVLRKLISEGREDYFGGMTQKDVKMSIQGNNTLYLVYRKGDEIPVVAISILRKESYPEFDEILEETPRETVANIYAMAVRPELQGQGYSRHALRLCIQELKEQGVKLLIGTFHPNNLRSIHLFEELGTDLVIGEVYTRKTPKGRMLPRKRFSFNI